MHSDKFTTPIVADSLRFAFTELAEFIDAGLREQTVSPFNRNRPIVNVNAVEELADTIMMLVTAIESPYTFRDIALENAVKNDFALMYSMGNIMFWYDAEMNWQLKAEILCHELMKVIEYMGYDPIMEVEQRLLRIYTRRIKPLEGEDKD